MRKRSKYFLTGFPNSRRLILKTLVFFLLFPFSALSIVPSGMIETRYAFAGSRSDSDDLSAPSGAPEMFPPVLLAAPGKFNPVLEAHGFDTQLKENCPLGLAFAMVFLEAAKRGLEDEDLQKFSQDIRINHSTVSSMANIAYEAQVNAEVLLAETNPPDVTALEKEFSDTGLNEIILKDSQFTGDSVYLMAVVFVLYGFPSDRVERILENTGLDFEAFYSQLGVTQRFLEIVYLLALPKNLGFKRADAVLPLTAEQNASGSASGTESPDPASAQEQPRVQWEVRETPVIENKDPSEGILERIKKDMEKANSRLMTLNHASSVDLGKAIRYLGKKIAKISAQLDQMKSGEISPAVELRRQRVLEMLTGLENKREELNVELEHLKADAGAGSVTEESSEGPSIEEMLDAKDELLFRIQNTDKSNLDAVEGVTKYLENEIRNLEEFASHSDVSTESVIRAITAELVSELKRLIGIKNMLIANQVQGQTRNGAPAVEEKIPLEETVPEVDSGLPLEKPAVLETEPVPEENAEARRMAEELLSETRQEVSSAEAQLGSLSSSDENGLEENIGLLEATIRELQGKWERIPAGAGGPTDARKAEIQKYIGMLQQRTVDLRETLDALKSVREEEYSAAEKTVEQINMTFEGLCSELENIPQDSAALDARIEEVSALSAEFVRKAGGLSHSTEDPRIEGFQRRIQSMVQNLGNRLEELESRKKELLDKAAAEKAEAERLVKAAEAERQAAAEKAEAQAKKAAAEKVEAERLAKVAEAERQAAAEKADAEAKKTEAEAKKAEALRLARKVEHERRMAEEKAELEEKNRKALIALEAAKKAEAEKRISEEKIVPDTSALVKEEEEICRALYEKVSAELQRLESLHPSIRTKGVGDLESYLDDVRAKKESFLNEYNLLPNSTGAISIVRMEESLADMLEEMGSFEVQVSERLRVVQLREKRIRDEEQAVLNEMEVFGRRFREEVSRTGDQADVSRLDYFMKQLEEFIANSREQLVSMSIPELKGKGEEMLAALEREGSRLEEQKNGLLKKQEEFGARTLLEQKKASAGEIRRRLSGISKTDLRSFETAEVEVEQWISGLRTDAGELPDHFSSDEVKSCRNALSELALEFETEREKLGSRIQELKNLERDEIEAARKCLESWSERQRRFLAESEGAGEDLPLIAAGLEKVSGLQGGLSGQAGALLNTTGSERVDEIRRELSGIAAQLEEANQKLKDSQNRFIRVREERIAQELCGRAEKELEYFNSVLARAGETSARELEKKSGDLENREAELRGAFNGLENTMQSTGVSFLQSKIENMLATFGELNQEVRARLEAANRREQQREKEESAARVLLGSLEAETDRLKTAQAEIAGKGSLALESLLQEVSANLKTFRDGYQNLSDETGSSAVKECKAGILSFLRELENSEVRLASDLRSIREVEQQRESDEKAARGLRDKTAALCEATVEAMRGLDLMSAGEISEKLRMTKQQMEELGREYQELTNTTSSESVNRLSEECAGFLEKLADCESAFSGAMSRAYELEDRRRKEELAVQELYEKVRGKAESSAGEASGLGTRNSSEIERFIAGLKEDIGVFEKEYQAVRNTTNSGKIEQQIPAVAGFLERLMECEKETEGILNGVLQKERLLRERETEAVNLCAQMEVFIDETSRNQNLLSENDSAAIRAFIENFKTKSKEFRNSIGKLESGERTSVIDGALSEAEQLLPALEEAGSPAGEKLRSAEIRENQRRQEENTVRDLKERIEKDLAVVREESAALDPKNAELIENFLKRLGEKTGMYGREYEAIQNTTVSKEITRDSRKIWELLDALERAGQDAEKILDDLRQSESLRREEEFSARDLRERITKERERMKLKIPGFEGMASADIEFSLSSLGSDISRYEEELRGLKNTAGSEEVLRESGEAGKALDEMRRLYGEGGKILAATQDLEARRKEEKRAAEDLLGRVGKTLTIFREDFKNLAGNSPEAIEIFLRGVEGKILAYRSEKNQTANTTGSGEVTRSIKETGALLEEMRILGDEGGKILAEAKARENVRREEEKLAEDLKIEVETETGRVRAELESFEGKNAQDARQFLDTLKNGISGFEGICQGLGNTSGSGEVERSKAEILRRLGELKGMQAEAETVFERVAEFERRKEEEEGVAERLKGRLIGEYESAAAKISGLGGKSAGIAEKELEDLREKILRFELEYEGLQNTTGSERVVESVRGIEELISGLRGCEIEMGRVLAEVKAREEVRLEEERLAEGLRKRVEREIGKVGAEFSGLGGKDAADLEEFLNGFRNRLGGYESEYEGLRNTSGSAEADRAAVEISEFLAELKGVEAEVEKLFEKARELEDRKFMEEEAARIFNETVLGDLAEVQVLTGELEGRRSEEIGEFLSALEGRISGYEIERNALKNTTGSGKVTQKITEAGGGIEELKRFKLDIAEFLGRVRDFESRRNEEERAAEDFRERIAREMTALNGECQGLAEKSPAEIENFIETLELKIDEAIRESSSISNTTGSERIAETGRAVSAMLSEAKQIAAEARDVLNEKAAFEARRQEEGRNARELRASLEETLEVVERDFAGLEQRSSTEVENLVKNLKLEILNIGKGAGALTDTTGSLEVSGEIARAKSLLEDLKKRSAEAEEILERMKRLELRRQEEETAARDLKGRVEGFLGEANAACGKLDLKDIAGAEEFLGSLRSSVAGYENEMNLLRDAAGSQAVLEAKQGVSGLLDELELMGKGIEGRIEEERALEARRREEEQAALNLKTAITDDGTGAQLRLQEIQNYQTIDNENFCEALKLRIGAYFQQYQSLKATDSVPILPEIEQLLKTLNAVAEKMNQRVLDAKREAARVHEETEAVAKILRETETDLQEAKDGSSTLEGKSYEEALAFSERWEALLKKHGKDFKGAAKFSGSEELSVLSGKMEKRLEEFSGLMLEVRAKLEQIKKTEEIQRREVERKDLEERMRKDLQEVRETARILKEDGNLNQIEGFLEGVKAKVLRYRGEREKMEKKAAEEESPFPPEEASGKMIREFEEVIQNTGQELEKIRENESRIKEEGAIAEELTQAIRSESGTAKRELQTLGDKSTGEVSDFLKTLNEKISSYEKQNEALRVKSVLEQTVRQCEGNTALLQGLRSLESEGQDILQAVKEFEERRQSEESAIRGLRENIERELTGVREQWKTFRMKPPAEIEGLLEEIKKKIGRYDGEYGGLKNTTGSETIVQESEKIWKLLDSLERVEKEIEDALEGKKEKKVVSPDELNRIRERNRKLEKESEKLREDLGLMSEKDPAEIESFLGSLERRIAVYEKETGEVKNSSGSRDIEQENLESKRLIAELKKKMVEAKEAFAGLFRFEENRKEEEIAVGDLEKRIGDDLREVDAEFGGLEEKGPGEIEIYLEDLRGRILRHEAEYGELKNTTGSEAVARASEKIGRLLGEFNEKEREVGKILLKIKEKEMHRDEFEARELKQAEKYLKTCKKKYQSALNRAGKAGDDRIAIDAEVGNFEKLQKDMERETSELPNTARSERVEEIRKEADKISGSLEREKKNLQDKRDRLMRGEEEEKARELYKKVEEELAHLESILPELYDWPSGNLESLLSELKIRKTGFEEQAGQIENKTGSPLVNFVRTNLAKVFKQLSDYETEIGLVLERAKALEIRRVEEEALAQNLYVRVREEVKRLEMTVPELRKQTALDTKSFFDRLQIGIRTYETERSALKNSTESKEIPRLEGEIDLLLGRMAEYEDQVGESVRGILELEKRRTDEERVLRDLFDKVKSAAERIQSEMSGLNGKNSNEVEEFLGKLDRTLSICREDYAQAVNTTNATEAERLRGEIAGMLNGMNGAQTQVTKRLNETLEFEAKQDQEGKAALELRERIQKRLEENQAVLKDLESRSSGEAGGFLERAGTDLEKFREEYGKLSNTTNSSEVESLRGGIAGLLEQMSGVVSRAESILKVVMEREAARRAEEEMVLRIHGKIKVAFEEASLQMEGLEGKGLAGVKNFIEQLRKTKSACEDELRALPDMIPSPEISRLKEEMASQCAQMGQYEKNAEAALGKVLEKEAISKEEEKTAQELFRALEKEQVELDEKAQGMALKNPQEIEAFIEALRARKNWYSEACANLPDRENSALVGAIKKELGEKVKEFGRIEEGLGESLKTASEQEKVRQAEEYQIKDLYEKVQKELTAAEMTFTNAAEMGPENLRGAVTEFRERRKTLFDIYWTLAEGKNYSEMSPLLQKIPFLIEQMDDYERRLWQLLKEVHVESKKVPQDQRGMLQEIQQFKEHVKKRVSGGDGRPENIKEVIQDMESFLGKYDRKDAAASSGEPLSGQTPPSAAMETKGDTESFPKEVRVSREKPVEAR